MKCKRYFVLLCFPASQVLCPALSSSTHISVVSLNRAHPQTQLVAGLTWCMYGTSLVTCRQFDILKKRGRIEYHYFLPGDQTIFSRVLDPTRSSLK